MHAHMHKHMLTHTQIHTLMCTHTLTPLVRWFPSASLTIRPSGTPAFCQKLPGGGTELSCSASSLLSPLLHPKVGEKAPRISCSLPHNRHFWGIYSLPRAAKSCCSPPRRPSEGPWKQVSCYPIYRGVLRGLRPCPLPLESLLCSPHSLLLLGPSLPTPEKRP